jgi:hypothetical protein
MAGELEDLRRRLEAIAEELADLGLDRLRRSVEDGSGKAPADERRLARARRAVLKAAADLSQPDDASRL